MIGANINLRLGSIANNLTFDVAKGTTSDGIDLLVSGNITASGNGDGQGGIIKDGAGTMVLNGSNTCTGVATVNAGKLYVDGSLLRRRRGSGATTINQTSGATGGGGEGFFFDGGLQGTGTCTINAANAGSGVNLRNNSTSFSGTLIVNGIASTSPYAGSGIGVGGCATGLQYADITLNGTMELGNQGIGWANQAPGTFTIGALSGSGAMVANSSTGGGVTTVTVGDTNNSGSFSGTIADGNGDSLNLVITGSGTQVFSGANTYSGATTVNGGTLILSGAGNSNNSDITMANGANLTFAANDSRSFTRAINGTAGNVTFNVAGDTSASGGGSSVCFVLGNSGNFTGTVVINTGLVAPGADSAFGDPANVIQLNTGSGIGVGGCTTGLQSADITLNGTMELLNQGIGFYDPAPGVFMMGGAERQRRHGCQLYQRRQYDRHGRQYERQRVLLRHNCRRQRQCLKSREDRFRHADSQRFGHLFRWHDGDRRHADRGLQHRPARRNEFDRRGRRGAHLRGFGGRGRPVARGVVRCGCCRGSRTGHACPVGGWRDVDAALPQAAKMSSRFPMPEGF